MAVQNGPRKILSFLPVILSAVVALAFFVAGIIFAARPAAEASVVTKYLVFIVSLFSSIFVVFWGVYFRHIEEGYKKIRVSQAVEADLGDLNEIARRLIENKKTHAQSVASQIRSDEGYTVSKRHMYSELVQLCRVLDSEGGEELMAASDMDYEDFSKDGVGKDYLRAGGDCIGKGVPVRRLFVLDDANAFRDQLVMQAVDENYDAIHRDFSETDDDGRVARAQGKSGLLWLLRSECTQADRKIDCTDFALFGGERRGRILVVQEKGGTATGLARQCSMKINKKECHRMSASFERLWDYAEDKGQNYEMFKQRCFEVRK